MQLAAQPDHSPKTGYFPHGFAGLSRDDQKIATRRLRFPPLWGNNPAAPPTRRDCLGCGCSSGVEHNLAKVGVEGSNPFARSRQSQDLRSMQASDLPALFAFLGLRNLVRFPKGSERPWLHRGYKYALTPIRRRSLFEAILPMPLQEMRMRAVASSQRR